MTVSKPLAEYYRDDYYAHSCGENTPYRRDQPAWVAFFGRLAERLVAEFAPGTVLDAGCAMGLLVEALRDRGVEAWGLDFSSFAIDQVRADIRPFCWVGSVTQDLQRDYDLITCIEVLEHLPPDEAEIAVANLTSHTHRVLFSSTPDDYREPTHLNVRPPDYWAGVFALHGFYRDLDFDAPWVAPHAVLFRRQRGMPTAAIRAYERRCSQLATENRELRAARWAADQAHIVDSDGTAASETERRLFATIVGAGRLIAPSGTRQRRVLRSVVTRFVDVVDWAYVRARGQTTPEGLAPAKFAGSEAALSEVQQHSVNGLGEPFGAINGPRPGTPVRVVTLLWGWALDRASTTNVGVTAIRVYLDGVWKGTATYGLNRADVADQFGQQFRRCGWEFALDVQSVSPGPHTVQVAAHSSVSGLETTYSHPLVVEAPLAPPKAMKFALFISGSPGDPMRYRCHHQAQQLQLLGITADVGAYGEVALGDVVDNYHVFVLHRVLLSDDVAWFIDEAHRRGRVVLYDTDDLVFDLDATSFIASLDRLTDRQRESFLDCVARSRQALLRCDAVFVSTQPLQEIAGRIHRRVVVNANVVDRNMVEHAQTVLRYRAATGPTSQRPDGVTIAYLCGSPTHDRDFGEVADALIWALDTYPVARLVTVGPLTIDARFKRFGDRVAQLPLRPWGQLPELIANVDISLAPLEPDNPFTEAKSSIKYFEAALVGVPTIASPHADFVRVMLDGVTGFLASGAAEWQAALARLIESRELRCQIGERARQDVLEHHTTSASALALLTTLRELMPVAVGDQPMTINWVVRPMVSRPVSRLAGELARRGHRVRMFALPRAGALDHDAHSGPVIVETVESGSSIPPADISIATDPSTAQLVATQAASPYRAYFIQDPSSAGFGRLLPLRRIRFGDVADLADGPVAHVDAPARDDDPRWADTGAQLERVLREMAIAGRVLLTGR